MGLYLILIIWLLLAFKLISNFWETFEEIGWLEQLCLMLILTFGAPFFFIVEILEFLIDLILGEGWDKD